MAECERALDRITVTFDMKILDLVKLETIFRKPGMSRTSAMDSAIGALLKGYKTTKPMQDKAKELYDFNVERRERRRAEWVLKRGTKRRKKRGEEASDGE